MLEQVFGSKTRVKMMKIFLENPDKLFYVRELTRLTDSLINSVRRELDNLLEIGFVVVEESRAAGVHEQHDDSDDADLNKKKGLNTKKYFRLNKNNVFRNEFDALFSKGKLMVKQKFTDRLQKAGQIRYLCLSGFFVDNPKSSTDVLIIGTLEKDKIQKVIKDFEADIKRELNYTLMDVKEYRLRRDINDRFLRDILDDPNNLVLVNDLKIIDEV